MQVLLTPIAGGQLAANRILGGPAGLVRLQDSFAANVGARYGMRRGERGSKARHTSIKTYYAAIEAARKTDALPRPMSVPALPEPPGLLSGSQARADYDLAVSQRGKALEHNRRVQSDVQKLAELGLAVHGRARRTLAQKQRHTKELVRQGEIAKEVKRLAEESLMRLDAGERRAVLEAAKRNLQLRPIVDDRIHPEPVVAATRPTPRPRPKPGD